MSNFNPADYTLLVVDDEEDLAEIIAEELSEYGFKMRIAFGAQEALGIIQREPIDYVISDVKMAKGDGMFLLTGLQQHELHLPVVLMMTGQSEYSETELKNQGAAGLLDKPIEIEHLYEQLKKHFSSLQVAS
ncbi:response regulator [Pseudobacteriovorax antillogorgiicola]|uniref:Response regulator receiver domain-containing protein n=1 Tax=Pseudobacteriovorax antillogorgiicola TaxID=1513793 RepID=A0A1Y6CPJ5_9BACT|nr:response regulator [Pseudobacteriovorax antillogorgiicola]TCS42856.1 response regulator receiver domain-containing protein [Pseudobacteriovorax antillogorgiicola]SMF81889.1 Response regulator receiver domain-containing protein [Pseudobacteriovorax antillogorgiicola]